jgi:hypothetical protein
MSARTGSKMRTSNVQRRRWACPDADCAQDRITRLDVSQAPICPEHAVSMTKHRKVVRRRGR